MTRSRRSVSLLRVAAAIVCALAVMSCSTTAVIDAALGNAPFNDYRLIGTHNSYHIETDPAVKALLQAKAAPAAAEFLKATTYSHLPLATQLDLGVRQFELDLYRDPVGGRFASPGAAAPASAMGLALEAPIDPGGQLHAPGMKVLHVPDVDWRSTCPTFSKCLSEIADWSTAHPKHFPIVIVLDLKGEGPNVDFGVPLVEVLPFDHAAIQDVEREVQGVIPRKQLFIPDDLRRGSLSLKSRVESEGWPRISAMRGKVLLILSNRALVGIYRGDNAILAGRTLFADVEPDDPAATFIERLDPTDKSIPGLQARGFMVQTFADFRTSAARDNSVAGKVAALRSGAGSISTDYITEDRRFSSYSVRFPAGGYVERRKRSRAK